MAQRRKAKKGPRRKKPAKQEETPSDDAIVRDAYATVVQALNAAALTTSIEGFQRLQQATLIVRDFIASKTSGEDTRFQDEKESSGGTE